MCIRDSVDIAWKLKDMGYKLYGTSGTCAWLNKHMVPCNEAVSYTHLAWYNTTQRNIHH